jgi:hypothetical protein
MEGSDDVVAEEGEGGGVDLLRVIRSISRVCGRMVSRSRRTGFLRTEVFQAVIMSIADIEDVEEEPGPEAEVEYA